MPTVFPIRHNWREPYVERWSWLTDVLMTDDGSEQRVALTTIPRRTDTLHGTPTNVASGRLDALLYGGQHESWAVPEWPRATRLSADATAGAAVVLACDTTAGGFLVGSYAVLYRSDLTTELVGPLSAKTGSSITVPTLAASWDAGAIVLPARLARWGADPAMTRLNTLTSDLTATFDYVQGTAPNVATPSEAVLFDVAPFTRRVNPQDSHARLVDRIDNQTDTFADYPRSPQPIGHRTTSPLWLPDHAAVDALLAWFHAVKGRLAPFLLPTYQQDLTVLDGLGTDTLTVAWIGYTDRLFPLPSRQRLALIDYLGAITEAVVEDAEDNGDGTETLTLDVTAPLTTRLVSYLLTVRNASDDLEIRWLSALTAEAGLTVVELPSEAVVA